MADNLNLDRLTRWTFDGGMTAEVSAEGQWVRFDDLQAARRAAPPVGDDGLPPLPKPHEFVVRGLTRYVFTADQYRQGQREAYEAGRRAAVPAQTGTQPAGDSVGDDKVLHRLLMQFRATHFDAAPVRVDIIAHIDRLLAEARRAAVSTASTPDAYFYTFSKPNGWINLLDPGQTWEAWTREQGPPTPRGWKVSGNRAPSSPVE